MNCKPIIVVFGAVVVFVSIFTTSASAGELIDDVLASIERSSPELASTLEEIFSLPEVQELVSVIASYFQQNSKIGSKQAGCQWHTPYSGICEFLDDLNDCTDIHKGKLTDAAIDELGAALLLLPLPAAQANWGWVAATRSNDKEDYFCDQAGKCPS